MAYQKDYILRMIEMMGDLIAAILGQIKKGDYDTATRSVENAYQQFLREDAAFFSAIPREKLTEKLLGEHNYTNGHLEILSSLFFAQAELLFATGKKGESLGFYEKSALLLEFVIKESRTYSSERESHLLSLKDRIRTLTQD